MIFDVCNKESFENVENWQRQISANSPKDIKKLLVGTNIDDDSKRQVSKEEGEAKGIAINMQYLEASINGEGLAEMFEEITAKIVFPRLTASEADSE